MKTNVPAEYIEKLSNDPDKIDEFYYYANYNTSSDYKRNFIRTTNLNDLRTKGNKTYLGIRNPTHILVFSKGPDFNLTYCRPFIILVFSKTRWAYVEPSEKFNYFDEGVTLSSNLYKDAKHLAETYGWHRIMRYSRGSFVYDYFPLGKTNGLKLIEWNIGIARNSSLELDAARHLSFVNITQNFITEGTKPIKLIKDGFLKYGIKNYSKEIYNKFHVDLHKIKVEECRLLANWGLSSDEIVTTPSLAIPNKETTIKEEKVKVNKSAAANKKEETLPPEYALLVDLIDV